MQCRAGRAVQGVWGDDIGEAHGGRLLQGAISDLPFATKARSSDVQAWLGLKALGWAWLSRAWACSLKFVNDKLMNILIFFFWIKFILLCGKPHVRDGTSEK
jgi:hypothetical protein